MASEALLWTLLPRRSPPPAGFGPPARCFGPLPALSAQSSTPRSGDQGSSSPDRSGRRRSGSPQGPPEQPKEGVGLYVVACDQSGGTSPPGPRLDPSAKYPPRDA